MKEAFKNEEGNTLIEIIMVMILLVLFGVTIYTLIIAGTNAQQRIINDKETEVNARIAMSYLNVRLKQGDDGGKVSIQKNPFNQGDSIVIRDQSNEYDTWIYWINEPNENNEMSGVLKECLVDANKLPDNGNAFIIVPIDGFKTEIDENGLVKNTVDYKLENSEEELTGSVYLRSVSNK